MKALIYNGPRDAEDGKPDREKMQRQHISENDILEAARVKGQVRNLNDIEVATLERSGEICIVPKA